MNRKKGTTMETMGRYMDPEKRSLRSGSAGFQSLACLSKRDFGFRGLQFADYGLVHMLLKFGAYELESWVYGLGQRVRV